MSETRSDEMRKPETRQRDQIDARFRWDLGDIFAGWEGWEAAHRELGGKIERFAELRGTLSQGAAALLEALRLDDELGQLAYRVWFYPALMYDEDQRNNPVDARRQQVQILLARLSEASSWFNPELLQIPRQTVEQWIEELPALASYRFVIDNLYRQQQHVLDEAGERLLSLGARFCGAPSEVYSALSTADMRFPEITLSDGQTVTVSPGGYRAILSECRAQGDRATAFEAHYRCFHEKLNTYAALYNAVAQRDWYLAQSRNYSSTLDAALFGNNIPRAVVETLIETTRQGTGPLRRYHRLRQRALGLSHYHLYDGSVPLARVDRKYPYLEALPAIVESVAPLGDEYQARMRRAVEARWIDVYENEGKRSGAYSAGVYGVHPYMLLNYNDTLDDVFTLAHELGHTLHTLLSHESQPFCYASYTIFVAEVASTLNEALLLDYLLARTGDPAERAVLLQRAIDSICGTFYTQVLFADWELQVHRQVERGEPLTATSLGELYLELLRAYYDDAVEIDELYAGTWARIPHFYASPYYVYQYATCFASSAHLLHGLRDAREREDTVQRYLGLLKAGSSDYPMALLARTGVDLGQPRTIQAVVDQLDDLVQRLEAELSALGLLS